MSYQSRISIAEAYADALGHAAYNFAYLEWAIVWLAETLQPGFADTVGSFPAGKIAHKFEQLVEGTAGPASDLASLKELAASFVSLANVRNQLMHGRPITDPGEQRLLYTGYLGRRDWSAEGIVEAARSFEDAAIKANDLLHNGRLQAYERATGRILPALPSV